MQPTREADPEYVLTGEALETQSGNTKYCFQQSNLGLIFLYVTWQKCEFYAVMEQLFFLLQIERLKWRGNIAQLCKFFLLLFNRSLIVGCKVENRNINYDLKTRCCAVSADWSCCYDHVTPVIFSTALIMWYYCTSTHSDLQLLFICFFFQPLLLNKLCKVSFSYLPCNTVFSFINNVDFNLPVMKVLEINLIHFFHSIIASSVTYFSFFPYCAQSSSFMSSLTQVVQFKLGWCTSISMRLCFVLSL